MLFSSPTFLVYFLPAVLLVALLLRTRIPAQNVFLLFASLFFYAWGEFAHTLVLLASMLANYAVGMALHGSTTPGRRRAWLCVGVVFNLALLGFFKYANFVVDNLNVGLASLGVTPIALGPVYLPIGVSFFTFQAMTYVIDVYRGDAPVERNPLRVGLYIALFPQLIAGPIVRFRSVAQQLRERRTEVEDLAIGIRRFVVGLGKKVLIADSLAPTVDAIFALSSDSLSPGVAWLGATAFALQIYFDFAGYSDMAIGLGRMFGFRFPENFNAPYVSRSVGEYWRRWHMSLSSWFRDYLYLPLMARRQSPLRAALALLFVFLLTGLWHGAAWNFVAWGGSQGLLLLLERTRFGAFLEGPGRPIARFYFLFVTLLALVLFRSPDLSHAADHLAAMFGATGAASAAHALALYLEPQVVLWLAVGVAFSGDWMDGFRAWLQRAAGGIRFAAFRYVATAWVFFASVVALIAGTNTPFIYFRF